MPDDNKKLSASDSKMISARHAFDGMLEHMLIDFATCESNSSITKNLEF